MKRLVDKLLPTRKPDPSSTKSSVSSGSASTPSFPCLAFQILSDLHLEVGHRYSTFHFPATAPSLILAGDVGRLKDYEGYLEFISRQTRRFKRVFLILGNHEFHGLNLSAGLSAAQKLEQERCLRGKLCLLQQTRVDVGGGAVTILGCTLWSQIPDHAGELVASTVDDFTSIANWTVDSHNSSHLSDLEWLKAELATVRAEIDGTVWSSVGQDPSASRRQVLVVTHHPPLTQGTLRPENTSTSWTEASATDVLARGSWDPVKTWVHGHTHHSCEFEHNGVNIISNQFGYPTMTVDDSGPSHEANSSKFDPEKVIQVPIRQELT